MWKSSFDASIFPALQVFRNELRKRKNVLDRGKFMCLQPWQGGGKNQGMGHKESAGQDGRTE